MSVTQQCMIQTIHDSSYGVHPLQICPLDGHELAHASRIHHGRIFYESAGYCSQKTEGLDAIATDKTPDHALRPSLILNLLMAFASISTDLYLPAMPDMAQALNIGAGTLKFIVRGTSMD